MLAAHMRRSALVIVVSLGALAASAAVALAHNTPYSWTVGKARVLLQEGTNISLPPDQRQALDAELEALLDEYRPLKLTALSEYETTQNPDYSRLAQTYASLIDRVEKAQTRINAGLSIDSVKCAGQGKALKGKRYKHFRCDATSYVQEIPSVELKPVAGLTVPEVVEGPRRLIGPLAAVFTVHVMGKSRMLSQRAS